MPADSPLVIGLAGRAYAGKTTIGNHLAAVYGFQRLAFADALKHMLIEAGMCTWDECYKDKTEKSRWLLQKVGTEIFRKQVHADFWVQQTAKCVKQLVDAGKSVVLDDIRFPNEAKLVHAYLGRGALIKVERYNTDGTPYRNSDMAEGNEHDSERLVDSLNVDYIIRANSGDVDGLLKQIDYTMNKLRGGQA